jgi:O-antigen/teichoic acid export membrane protein
MKIVTGNPSLESGAGVAPAMTLKTMRRQIVSGSMTLLASSGLVSAMNFAYNIATARLLGPTGYGHATAVSTLLMLMSAITLAFQIVCAKLVANHDSLADKAGIYARLHRRAWFFGVVIGTALFFARGVISVYLNLPDPMLIMLLALGTAFYIPLGVRRGFIQGTCAFNALAKNFLLEGVVRLGGALILIKLGAGVEGAVAANVAAIVLACLFASPQLASAVNGEKSAPFREGLQATVFFTGQVIINNFDIALVKHFFPSEEAGLYAAVALVGRLINMFSWSVISSMFPVAAKRRSSEEKEGTALLKTSLLLVFLILTLLISGLSIIPSMLWKVTYGPRFELQGYGSISSMMTLYAIASGIYSLSSVIIAYEMSRKIANTGWIQLAFSGALIAGIYLFHGTLHQVIMVQLVLMLFLLLAVLVPFLSFNLIPRAVVPESKAVGGNMRYLRPMTEDRVIAEFLKNEFHHPEFNEYRDAFKKIVSTPNFDSRDENTLRRALLFLRRGAMWRELPADTEWFEVELSIQDLARVRVFPRAQWRKVAQGSFGLNETVERIRAGQDSHADREFLSKLQRLRPLVHANLVNPTVLLIGADKDSPLTILDGNHRLAAAMLTSPPIALKRLRFICGFSPRMSECCWYQTNVVTLWRYAKNLVRYMPYDPKADISHFLQSKS